MTKAESIEKVILEMAGEVWGCGSDRCCCFGVEAFECKTGLAVAEMVERIAAALDNPSQITPHKAGS